MGHREDLLEGAKRCLYEKGYARTTARDIVAASGTNLGSIGYHYGSLEGLLNAAMLEAIDEWGEEVGRALAESSAGGQETMWTRMIESFAQNRPLWLASVEAFLQAERSPALKKQLAEGQQEGRRGMASLMLGVAEQELTEEQIRSVGSVQMALFSGLMVQWITDPSSAPSAKEIVSGLRALIRPSAPKRLPPTGRTRRRRE
jgi:AcrR family transcriptional regulator